MMHQDELEAELTYSFSKFAPEVIGNEYLVLGTIEKRVWQKGVKGDGTEVGEILKHVADFKKVYDLEYDPGGWYPEDAGRVRR